MNETTENIIVELNGRIIDQIEGLEADSEVVIFHRRDGKKVKMHHFQDCCEHVRLVDIAGEPSDLIGVPLQATCSSSSEEISSCDCKTWTFYKFRSSKGDVTLRWLGESNGYYSESVDISFVD